MAVFLLCSFFMYQISAQELNKPKSVRVGFFSFDGYHMMDAEGERSGYGYDMLQHMATYGNWTYEYIGYDKSWDDMQKMLANHEIDILTSAQKTESRLEKFAFSDDAIGYSATIVTEKAGNNRYRSDDYENWNGVRVGMLKNNSRNASFDAFAEDNGFTYLPVFYDNTKELISALQTGKDIDVIVTSNLRAYENEWVLAEFDYLPFYVMVNKDDKELLTEVNEALEQVMLNEPELQTRLWNKYYSVDSGDEIFFTTEQQNYIEAMQGTVFKALVNPDRRPYSYFEDGEPKGIISDIVKEAAARTGLQIEFVETKNREEYNRLKESGEIDIRFDAWYNYSLAEAEGYKLTSPYLSASISRLYRKENNSRNFSIAALKGSDISKKYIANLPGEKEITYYDTVAEVVDAVYERKQDQAYLYSETAALAAYDDITNSLTFDQVYNYSMDFSAAVSTEQNVLLVSILDRAVRSISQEEISQIVNQYTDFPAHPFSIIGYMHDNPIAAIVVVAVCFLLVSFIVLFIFARKKHMNEHKRMLEEKKHNEALTIALAAAEQADLVKNQFLSRVSHEIRTPLNAIIGLLALIRDEDCDTAQREEYMNSAETAGGQLLAVINDVLDMSSIEAGKMKITNEPFNFRQFLSSVSKMYQSQCEQKGISFELKIMTPIEDFLTGDQFRINQVLMNLLGNAVKFTQKGHIWLSVWQMNQVENKVFLRFEISDTGCGMNEEMLTRAFKPFEQESALTAQQYGGSGLGLSIVKNLTSLMGGAVDVHSKEGEGTTFVIDLPFAISETAEKKVDDKKQKSEQNLTGKRILLAEDNEINSMVAERLLKKLGVMCDIVPDGQTAVERFTSSEPGYYDAIFMDIQMPVLNGFQATEAIRKSGHPYADSIYIVALTANVFKEDITKCLSCGMNAHVAKPVRLDALAAALSGAEEANRKQRKDK